MGANAFIPQGPRATSATTSSKGERLAILSIAAAAVLAACVYYGAIVRGDVLYSTSSPDGKYKIEIVQTRDFTLYERSVHLTARRNRKMIVSRKVLYTGDVLDSDFRDLYPDPRWTSNSSLELGRSDNDLDDQPSEFKIINESSSTLGFVLIEGFLSKIIIFEVEPKSTVFQRLRVRGWVSCEGRYAGSSKRFGVAASVVGSIGERMDDHDAMGRFVITIRESEATIESPQVPLQPTSCCAPDRPDYEHE